MIFSQYLFHLKPQPNSTKLDVVSGVGIKLRQGMNKVYIPYKLSQKVVDWKPKWFYVENQGKIQVEWLKKPLDTSQISELLKLIANLG